MNTEQALKLCHDLRAKIPRLQEYSVLVLIHDDENKIFKITGEKLENLSMSQFKRMKRANAPMEEKRRTVYIQIHNATSMTIRSLGPRNSGPMFCYEFVYDGGIKKCRHVQTMLLG